jgi:hypothetical protein
MLALTHGQLGWLPKRIPDLPKIPKGRRVPEETRKVVQGMFRMLDYGAPSPEETSG